MSLDDLIPQFSTLISFTLCWISICFLAGEPDLDWLLMALTPWLASYFQTSSLIMVRKLLNFLSSEKLTDSNQITNYSESVFCRPCGEALLLKLRACFLLADAWAPVPLGMNFMYFLYAFSLYGYSSIDSSKILTDLSCFSALLSYMSFRILVDSFCGSFVGTFYGKFLFVSGW